jgi:hypothetical protein
MSGQMPGWLAAGRDTEVDLGVSPHGSGSLDWPALAQGFHFYVTRCGGRL